MRKGRPPKPGQKLAGRKGQVACILPHCRGTGRPAPAEEETGGAERSGQGQPDTPDSKFGFICRFMFKEAVMRSVFRKDHFLGAGGDQSQRTLRMMLLSSDGGLALLGVGRGRWGQTQGEQ